MKAMCFRGMRGQPICFHPDFLRQNSLKPLRCQAITVAGLTMTSGRAQSGQSLQSATQKARSLARSLALR